MSVTTIRSLFLFPPLYLASFDDVLPHSFMFSTHFWTDNNNNNKNTSIKPSQAKPNVWLDFAEFRY